ncbi:alpha/beta hydrolase [Tunturibacter psychrotolerans]|uniref:Alpha/beta hydrolase n=1 Tax=Tunturiibacter psychrotolerans TaxID=3069686 RepID=A0AAU7ZS34_9BACT
MEFCDDEFSDDDLTNFEAHGATLPANPDTQGYVEHKGAQIWYATYGSGSPVILLHGGFGHSGNWSYQLPDLFTAGHRVIFIDSRGHGRSTRDDRPYSYELMASDVLAVMDTLHLERAALVGWSDGACIALILADQAPFRVAGAFFFGCNMDPSGLKQINERNPLLHRCLGRHAMDYAQLSPTPDQFNEFAHAVRIMMNTQPNYTSQDLARVSVPVAIVQAEHDEFIKDEHAEYLARTIPNAKLIILKGVSHFVPLQRPHIFNAAMLAFITEVLPDRPSMRGAVTL